MRILIWIVVILMAVGLINYYLFWSQNVDKGDIAATELLTVDLRTAAGDIDRTLAELPDIPKPVDLERLTQLNQKTQELIPRIRTIIPKLKGESGKRFQAAHDHYLAKVDQLGVRLNEVKKKLDEVKVKG